MAKQRQRNLRQRRNISFDSAASSNADLDELYDDQESAQKRIDHLDMRQKGQHFPPTFIAPQMVDMRRLSQEKRLCSHSRCSASKERNPNHDCSQENDANIGNKNRQRSVSQPRSRSRSRGGRGAKL